MAHKPANQLPGQTPLPFQRQGYWLLWNSLGMVIVAIVLSQLLPPRPIAHAVFSTTMLDIIIPYLFAQYSLVFLLGQQVFLHPWFARSRWRGEYDYGRTDTLATAVLVSVSPIISIPLDAPCGMRPSPPILALLRLLIFMSMPAILMLLRSWYRTRRGANPYTNPTVKTFFILWGCWLLSSVLLIGFTSPGSIPICRGDMSIMFAFFSTAGMLFIWLSMTSASTSIYNPRWVITTALAGYGGMTGGLLIAWFALSSTQWPAWGLAGLLSGSLMATITLALWPWAMDHPERHHERPS